jgi:hypothetical protein
LSVGFATHSTRHTTGVSILQQLRNISAVSPHFRPGSQRLFHRRQRVC